MAQDAKYKNTNRSGSAPKRAARGKIRRPEAEAEAKEKEAAEKNEASAHESKFEERDFDELPPRAPRTPRTKKKTARDIAVSIFAVVFVLSMMIPSLASIIMGAQSASSSTDAPPTSFSVEQVDSMYASDASELENKLASNPNDTESLLALGKAYLGWASTVQSLVPGEEATAHADELYAKARDCFQRDIKLEDNTDAEVQLALCDLYSGDTEAAQKGLEAVVAKDNKNATAWLNLGFIYEQTNKDSAATAYQRAIDSDSDGSLGVQSYAQMRLDELEKEKTDAATQDDASAQSDTGSTTGDTANADKAASTDEKN